MAKGQYAGLYKSPGHFEDPEDYMNMADSMDYFRTFGAAPESVIDSNFRARQKFTPIEPENDELMGLRNLEALNADPMNSTTSTKSNNPTYGFMKFAEMAKEGKLASQSPADSILKRWNALSEDEKRRPFALDITTEMTSMQDGERQKFISANPSIEVIHDPAGKRWYAELFGAGPSNSTGSKTEYSTTPQPDMHTNEAFAYYTNLRDKLKKQIDELKAEIAFRDKVKKIKARMDPLWKAARIQAIFTGDMTPLYNIMNRYDQLEKTERDEAYRQKALQQTADLAKLNKEVEDNSKKEANLRSARGARERVLWSFGNYNTNPEDLSTLNDLFESFQKYKEASEIAGLDPKTELPDTRFEEIELALKEGLKQKEAKVKEKKENAEQFKKNKQAFMTKYSGASKPFGDVDVKGRPLGKANQQALAKAQAEAKKYGLTLTLNSNGDSIVQ